MSAGRAAAGAVDLLDPLSGRVLRVESPHVLCDDGDHDGDDVGGGGGRWPVVDGIAFLRADRDALRHAVLADLDRGDLRSARARLLADQDPFAPVAPPSHAEGLALVDDVEAGRAGLRDAMRRLHFGPVGDYFAHRTSTPTYLSGLGLIAQHGRPTGLVVDVACGIGHFLRDLSMRDVPVVGLDLVFSKLWLARHFVAPSSRLVCGDAMRPPIALGDAGGRTTVLCHDAFYFLPDKAAAASAFRRLAGVDGRVLVGHAHNASVDQGGVAGTPLDPSGYAGHFPTGTLYDDAEVGACALRGAAAPARTVDQLGGVEALSIAWSAAPLATGTTSYWGDLLEPPAAARLVVNPLLHEVEGRLAPAWPSERFAAEYRGARYLSEPGVTAEEAEGACRARGEPSASGLRATLARRRVLVDLPERW